MAVREAFTSWPGGIGSNQRKEPAIDRPTAGFGDFKIDFLVHQ